MCLITIEHKPKPRTKSLGSLNSLTKQKEGRETERGSERYTVKEKQKVFETQGRTRFK